MQILSSAVLAPLLYILLCFEVNDWFGFGLMNAGAMVNRSLSWRTVPDQIVCRSNNITVNG